MVKSAAHYTETALDEIKLLKCVSILECVFLKKKLLNSLYTKSKNKNYPLTCNFYFTIKNENPIMAKHAIYYVVTDCNHNFLGKMNQNVSFCYVFILKATKYALDIGSIHIL